MTVHNPEPITLKNFKSSNVKQKIINNFNDTVFAVVLDGLADPKESFPDANRRIHQTAKIHS